MEVDMTTKTKNGTKEEKILSITEAADRNGVTRQAIYVAIKLKKLRATKTANRWQIKTSDLEEYRQNKYSRTKSLFDGQLLFDPNKGYHSVNQVARILNVPAQKIYYATRVGQLKAHRKGAAWVIQMKDVESYRGDHLAKRKNNQRKAS
jgi:excisionase family DNA binding protein